MRTGFVAAVGIACVLGLAVNPVSARVAINETVVVDEWGNGTDNYGYPMPGAMAADPTGRVAGNVLVYPLPASMTPVAEGEIAIFDIDWENFEFGPLSNVVTFYQNNLILYSTQGGGAPADTGLPTTLLHGGELVDLGNDTTGFSIITSKFGDGGSAPWDSYDSYYGELPADPGYYGPTADGSLFVSYCVSGTELPEPSSLVLLGLGVMGLLGYTWRRRRAKA